mmetsp:Transcript_12074/g.31957  ORF Transcript_12074/g.31957 Transcript_12074/m.31957 type:complete len:208 (+) Transcript_12074:2113-2736(+)
MSAQEWRLRRWRECILEFAQPLSRHYHARPSAEHRRKETGIAQVAIHCARGQASVSGMCSPLVAMARSTRHAMLPRLLGCTPKAPTTRCCLPRRQSASQVHQMQIHCCGLPRQWIQMLEQRHVRQCCRCGLRAELGRRSLQSRVHTVSAGYRAITLHPPQARQQHQEKLAMRKMRAHQTTPEGFVTSCCWTTQRSRRCRHSSARRAV